MPQLKIQEDKSPKTYVSGKWQSWQKLTNFTELENAHWNSTCV